MKLFRTYFSLECKKTRGSIPSMLVGLLVLFALGGFILFSWQLHSNAEKKPTTVGIVASDDEPYMDLFLAVLKNTKSLQDSYEFIMITQEEANKKFAKDEISVVFQIPENYVNKMIVGDVEPITIQFGNGDAGIASLLMRQLSQSVSSLLLNTQAGIYAMDDYYFANNLPNQQKDEQTLNIEYIKKILNRHTSFEVEEIQSENGLSYTQYYATVILLLLFLFLGLVSPKVFRPENTTFEQKLSLAGLNTVKQFICRQLASWLLFASFFLGLALLFSIIVSVAPVSVTDFSQDGFLSWMGTFLPMLFTIPMICTFLGLVYELIPDLTASILFLFLCILLLGYLSGYFYPIAFLPKGLQLLSAFLPTRVLFQYASGCVSQNISLYSLGILILYTVILLFLSILLRKKRGEVHTL